MVKNTGLVYKMSLEQRIQLITSVTLGKSGEVEGYEFPAFNFSKNPVMQNEDVYATHFLSDKALAQTWNLPLVRNIYKLIGNEAKATVPYAYFDVSNSMEREKLSEDYYFAGKVLAQKARGLNASGAYVNFTDAPDTKEEMALREGVHLLTDAIMKNATCNSLLTKTGSLENFTGPYKFKGITYAIAENKEEVARAIYEGATLIFLQGDFAEEVTPYIDNLAEEYRKSFAEFKAHKINLAEFDRRARAVEILDEELVDEACDRMVDALLDLRSRDGASVEEVPATYNPNTHTSDFNEPMHDSSALRAARQSVVLLKNQNKTLPVDPKLKAAVIGDSAKNPFYRKSIYPCHPTADRFPFDVINDYDIPTVGYAHGWEKNDSGRNDLIETSLKLCSDADYIIVYLFAEKGAHALSEGQLELINALWHKGLPIIAVVSADDIIDFSFEDKCDAVLFTCRGGQASANAVFDIITGKVSPSGRLTETVPRTVEGPRTYGALPDYCIADKTYVRYPFGYGLSFTHFEYSNMEVTERGVSCRVTNAGERDSFAVVQMYVQRPGSGTSLSLPMLRGFTKTFIKRGETVKVEIPFNENTFRCYNAQAGCYFVEGGNYNVYLGENAYDVRLSGEVTMEPFTYDKEEVYEREIAEVSDYGERIGFTKDEVREKAIREAQKSLPFGLKLAIAIVLMLYVNVAGALLLFTGSINDKGALFYVLISVIMAAADILGIILTVRMAKRRPDEQYLHPNEVITDMIDKVGTFDEIAKVTYDKPVETAQEVFEEPEEEPDESALMETIKTYDNNFTSIDESVVFTQRVSFSELCGNLRMYGKARGLMISSPIRELWAAIASSKIVFLTSKNQELMPEFLRIFNAYFGNGDFMSASDDWSSPNDLLWRLEGDTYVTSDFANTVNAASKEPEHNTIAILNNVSMKNIRSYFRDFIAYSLYPSEEHMLALNEELTIRLPDNICYILVPSDLNYQDEMPPELVHASIQIEVFLSKFEETAEAVDVKAITMTDFTDVVKEAREKFFVSEKYWNKIDALVEELNKTESFSIGNKVVLQLEKFTALAMGCGCEEAEAFQLMCSTKLIPLLKTTKTYRKEGGDREISSIFERLFPDEDLTKIKRQLLRNV